MDQTFDPPPDAALPFDRVIADYLDAVARGDALDREALLAANPDCAEELRQFLEDHDRAMEVAGPWRIMEAGQADGDQRTATLQVNASPDGQQASANGETGLGRLGDYELLSEIARGGMGVVYKARQVSLNRLVAVKMILPGRLASPEEIERFHLEAAAAAKLKHPNITIIYEIGHRDGRHFFSMEYVEGRSLAELLRAGPLPPKQAAQILHQVAEAVHFAHEHHVLHRDLKPSNVLIDEAGRAHVMDFGLAKQIDQSAGLTLSGEIIGTPAYMAPEQIASRRGEIGPACDVYGLGALLYELLTGEVPLRGRDHFETLLYVLECEPQSPRSRNPNVPRELELICLKCLEKEPERRYSSAQALADDLAHYLAGDSISVSSPKLVDRLVRTMERSQYDQDVYTWSLMLFHFAWIVLVTHTLVFLNRAIELPHPLAWLVAIRLLEIMGMGIVLWLARRSWYPVRGAPARQVLSLGLGYLTGALALLAVAYGLAPQAGEFDDFRVYPPMAVLASLLFIVLGSSYWGYCYAVGGAFLLLAFELTFWLPVAPLLFGIAWAASLTTLGLRLRRLARGH